MFHHHIESLKCDFSPCVEVTNLFDLFLRAAVLANTSRTAPLAKAPAKPRRPSTTAQIGPSYGPASADRSWNTKSKIWQNCDLDIKEIYMFLFHLCKCHGHTGVWEEFCNFSQMNPHKSRFAPVTEHRLQEQAQYVSLSHNEKRSLVSCSIER